MFLQVAVPNEDSRCLRFLWQEDPEQRMEVYEYKGHVFGGEELADLCKLGFASSGEKYRERRRKSCQSSPAKLLHGRFPQVSPNTSFKKRLKSTRKSETSSSNVDSI